MRCVALPGLCMSNRSVKFVPALFAGVVAGASLATVTDLRAQVIATAAEAATPATQAAADSCLSAPKGATPSGSHWYYRIDRVTKRQCWYLREESDTADDKFARAAPPASAPAPLRPQRSRRRQQQRTITRKSIADARAEWVSQQPRAEPNPPARVERTAAAAAPAPVVQNSPRAAMPNVLAPAPLSSMRWNDAPTTSASGNPTDLQVAAADSAGRPAAAGRGSAAARGRSDCARRCGRGAGKADRIAAEAASGDGRRPRAGRPHGKRDRSDRPHAGAPRHAPQAARDVGFRKDEDGVRRNRCSTTRTPGCGAPEACTIRAYPRTGHAHPRSVHARLKSGHAYHKSGRAYLKSGRRACLKSGHARPRNATRAPRSRAPGSRAP